MGQSPAERKKQYIAVAIVVAVVVSATAILIAFTQQEEESALINTNPLMQRPGSSTPTGPSAGSTQSSGQSGESAAEIAVSPSASDAEGQVKVEGAGFEPDEKVTVTIENAELETEPPAVAADDEGRFSAEATVPALPPGQYQVVATGEAGSSATQPVTIT